MSNNNFVLGSRSVVSFNCLIVGENGCGKTTFGNEILQKYILSKDNFSGQHENKNEMIECVNKVGVYKLSKDCNIHLYESNDYGNAYDYREQIKDYKNMFTNYHNEWNRIAWNTINEQELKQNDKRIHCIFYVVLPHTFKDRDLLFLEEISTLVPIVLVISKSDSMTINERTSYRARIDHLIKQREKILQREILFHFKEQQQIATTSASNPSSVLSAVENIHSKSSPIQMKSSDSINTDKAIISTCEMNSSQMNASLSYIDVTPIVRIQATEDDLHTGTATASLTTTTASFSNMVASSSTMQYNNNEEDDDEEILYGLEHSCNHYCDNIPSSLLSRERYDNNDNNIYNATSHNINDGNNNVVLNTTMITNIFAVINGSYIDCLTKNNSNEMTQHYTTSNRVYPWGNNY